MSHSSMGGSMKSQSTIGRWRLTKLQTSTARIYWGRTSDSHISPRPLNCPDVVLGAGFTQQLTTILGTAPVSFSLSDRGVASRHGYFVERPGERGSQVRRGFLTLRCRPRMRPGVSIERLCVMRVLQPVAPPAGLVAWWRGEPAVGGVVSDLIGGYNGGFFSGAVAAPPAHTADGKVGSAFAFNGTQYVRIPDAIELRPPAMTVEAWIFPTLLGPDTTRRSSHVAPPPMCDPAWLSGMFSGRPPFLVARSV